MMYPDEDELRKAVEQFEGYFVNVDQTVDQPIRKAKWCLSTG